MFPSPLLQDQACFASPPSAATCRKTVSRFGRQDSMMVAPLPDDEDARLAALREYQVLDTLAEDAYDDIVRLAAFICGTPIAAVGLVDAERQWFKSILGFPAAETPRSMAFCAYTILQRDLMVVPDTTQDVRFADNPLVTGSPHVRFYAGAPLITEGGYALGSLCVIDRAPRSLTPEQENALRTLARQVTNQLELTRRVAAQEQLVAGREQAENALRLLGGAVASATEGIAIADARRHDLPLTYVNPAFLALTGYDEHEVLGGNCRFLQGAATDPAARREIKRCLDAGRACRVTLLNFRKDGSAFWNELTVAPIRDAAGALTHFVGVQHDITALKEAEAALRQKEARLVEAQRIGRIGDWGLDVSERRFTWSTEVFRLMEFDPAQGEPTYEAVQARYYPADRAERDRLFARALDTGEPYQCDLRLLLPSGTPRCCHLVGHPITDEEGKVVRVAGTVLDITERMEREQQVRDANLVLEVQKAQLQSANAELAALATTDPLTGLLNYRAFQTRLAEEAARSEHRTHTAAVALLDVDDFRFFNDAYGHAVGDAVLRQVAARLRKVCGSADAVARFGGDEFTVLLTDAGRTATPAEVEARLRAGLAGLSYQPLGEATSVPITVSVGAALLPQGEAKGDAARSETLRRAEERLHRAKTGGEVETAADRVRAHAGRSLSGFSMLDALVTAVDNKDRYTRRHSEDVMEYSLTIARQIGMESDARDTVAVAALLHDVGKIGIPDAILRKPGRLTDEEFEAVKQHPQMGAIMVNAVPGLEGTLDAVRHHHERWDGGGYPFGLVGAETPLIARLMAVADAFSAMTTDRPYRKGMVQEKALSLLAEGAGTQWDPACVEAFLAAQQGGWAVGARRKAMS